MGKPAARLTDMHTCPMVTPGTPPIPHVGGPISGPCVPPVLIGFLPAATVGDMCVCVGPPDTIAMGSPTVFIGGKMAARMGDPTAHGGVIVVGCPTVLIGEVGMGGASITPPSPPPQDSWWEQALKGEFSVGDPTIGGALAQVAIGLIPVVGQIADIRDIIGASKKLIDDPTWSNAGNLALNVAGLIPLIGDGVKQAAKVSKVVAKNSDELAVGASTLQKFSGTAKPWTNGASPNSLYTHIDPKTGKAVQNAVYDQNGDVVAHIDFKSHGPGAPSGHGHTFPEPGNPASGHGAGKTHYPPGELPSEWSELPNNIQPHTP